jgi:hypothetical protein
MCVLRRRLHTPAERIVASQAYTEKGQALLLINICEFDEQLPPSFSEMADEKFASFAHGYRRAYCEGVHHGFTTRGDLILSSTQNPLTDVSNLDTAQCT